MRQVALFVGKKPLVHCVDLLCVLASIYTSRGCSRVTVAEPDDECTCEPIASPGGSMLPLVYSLRMREVCHGSVGRLRML